MSQGARVESIDQVKAFREALVKFADEARGALTDAESELRRVRDWLERDQLTHWKGRIKKREQVREEAKLRLQQKKLYPDASGGRQSYVEEQKAFRVATRRLEEATEKLANVKKWQKLLEKETMQYHGRVQAIARVLEAETPRTLAWMDQMIGSLGAYVALGPPTARPAIAEPIETDAALSDAAPSMAREPAAAPEPETDDDDKSPTND